MRIAPLFALIAALVLAGPGSAQQEGDPERGAKQFRKCRACHQVGPDAVNRIGPALRDIVGKPVAADPEFKYSNALRILGEAGTLWTNETLDAFLTRPRDFAKGTKMAFSGMKKARDRADIIAFLASAAHSGSVEDTGFHVSAEILAIEGDPEYGEYLSSECVTCHQEDGQADGIPSIVGWATEDFVTALHAYRGKHRDNSVMQMISGRLSDEEIAALASYFKSLGD